MANSGLMISREKLQRPLRVLAAGAALACALAAQAPNVSVTHARAVIKDSVDDSRLVPLGRQSPVVPGANDRGRVKDDVALDHMVLVLRRPAEQEGALESFLAQQSDPTSSNYHRWLTAAEYGARFGLAQQDLAIITKWLVSYGLTVNTVYANGVLIDFSGTAGQVCSAFHTEIHQIEQNGHRMFINISTPQIPAALAPAIIGMASLNDAQPHPAKAPAVIQIAGLKTYRSDY